MTATLIHVAYDTSRPSASLGSYRVSITETDEAVTGELAKRGPTFNGTASYQGVFATRRRAFEALAQQVGAPFTVVEDVIGGEASVYLGSVDMRSKPLEIGRRRILFRSTSRGTFVSAEA